MGSPMTEPVKVRWSGTSDGPWVHVDEIIKYLNEANKSLDHLGEQAAPYKAIISQLSQYWTAVRASATKKRLERVAGLVNAESLTADLVSLRDALGEQLRKETDG